jgi:hypothetical protein
MARNAGAPQLSVWHWTVSRPGLLRRLDDTDKLAFSVGVIMIRMSAERTPNELGDGDIGKSSCGSLSAATGSAAQPGVQGDGATDELGDERDLGRGAK